MRDALQVRIPFAVVGAAALVGLAVTPPPPGLGQAPAAATSTAAASEASVADLERQMAETLQDVETKKAHRDRDRAEIKALRGQRKDIHARLRQRARALYRMSRAGMLPLAGGFPALLEHVGRLDRLEELVEHDLGALRNLRTRCAGLRDEVEKLGKSIDEANGRFGDLQARKAGLEQQQAAAAQYAQTFTRSAAAPAAPRATGSDDELDYGGIRVVDAPPSGLGSDFAALRGRLELPVTGDFRVQETNLGEGPALRFVEPAGSPVRAAAEGKVAFSDEHGDYGHIIILDHGDGYFTVYGNIGHTDVQVGDYIGPRARIGTVATDAGLIFEVRHRTRSLPPRPWLGL